MAVHQHAPETHYIAHLRWVGHPDYLGPADKRSKAFHDDRVIAAVMVLAPSFISGVRERKRLVPADLDMLERLALKALGPTFEAKIERWQYDHPKYYR